MKKRRARSRTIRIAGPCANDIVAKLFVDQDGAGALKKTAGPMRAAVEAELRRRGMLDSSPS